ncbi:putative myosin-binding protein [Helianthus annuus]|nr:putative myosin-binding protein [Helianthus annuus]
MAATKGIMDHLITATCEWILMFWMFVEAAIAYSLRKFAKYCKLQRPCLLCSRLDHLFGNEDLHLFCKRHQLDVSHLIYCNVHEELVDVREMCEDCANSASLETRSNSESYRFVGEQRSYYACSCCKSGWKEKSTGQQPIWSNVSSRGSKATTKPPLPRVSRHGRPKRPKNKVKHRHRDALSPVGQYPGIKFTSDSELEFLFSDTDDGGFKVVGITERSMKNDENDLLTQYKNLGKHAHSTPDLRSSFLLEAHLNECPRTRSRTRSASLTPDCLIRHNLVELKRRSDQFDPLKIGIDKNPSSSMNAKTRGSFDGSIFLNTNIGSQNRCNIFSRHSFSAADLGSAIRLEMQNNNPLRQRSASLTPNMPSGYGLGNDHLRQRSASLTPNMSSGYVLGTDHLRQRSASLTPNMSSGYGFGEHQMPKNVHPKEKKHKKVSSNRYGYLDDSVVLINAGKHHNRSKIPRRHSYSVFQLGGDILLNMPTDESQNGSILYGFDDYKKLKSRSPEQDFMNTMQFAQKEDEAYTPLQPISFIRGDLPVAFIDRSKWYGSFLDDSAVMRNTGIQYQDVTPRRHSHSFFDLGREFVLKVPANESLTNSSASFAPRGSINYGFEQPNNMKSQTRPNPFAESVRRPRRKSKRGKKSNRISGYESLDDLVVSLNTQPIHDRNKDPRRHSYSAFELGDALLMNAQPIDRSLTNRSASVTRNDAYNHGFGEPKQPVFQTFQTVHNFNQPTLFLNKNQGGYQSMDDLVVSFNTGFYEKNKDPRRHSYSAFELGSALLLNAQPIDRSSTMTQNGAYNHGFGESKQSGFQTMNNSSHPLVFLNKNQGYGFMDDSVVTRKTVIDNHNHYHNQNKLPRRHSYSILQLGGDIVLNMPVDESISQSFGDPQRSFQKVERDNNLFSLPPTGSVKRFRPSYDVGSDLPIDKSKWHGSFDDYLIYRSMASQSQSSNPRRHSHSALDLGRALLLEINLENSLRNFNASSAPHGSTGHGSTDSTEHNRSHHHRAKRNNSQLPPPCPMNHPLGSSSDSRNDLPTFSFDTNHGVRSMDDSFFSHKTGNHNQNQYHNGNPRRHSYSAFELGCALLLNMQRERDASSIRRSASLTPKIQIVKESQLPNFKKAEPSFVSVTTITDDLSNLSSTSLYKPHGYLSCDDSGVSKSGQKRSKNLTRNYYSVSDLTSPVILQMTLDEGLTKKSASLTPDFGDINSLKFQAGSASSQQRRKKNERSKAKRNKRSKAKKGKKPLRKVNNVKPTSSTTNALSDASYESFEDSDAYESFDDSDTYESNADSQNRFNIFSRNSQSVSDLGSAVFHEMQPEDRSRNRSKSLTPESSYFFDDPVQFTVKKGQEKNPAEVEKDKKPLQLPPTYPPKEMDSSSTARPSLCPTCSLDGSEIDYFGLEKVKRQAEDDVRCMRLLQSELEAERNAATVAANHAMNMITRLQQEKAALQMEALQYLRMMEEQAEYDMEALQKANELVEEKENEIQDLLNELEQYRAKYGYDPLNLNAVKSFDDEKRYILESLSTLEKKINQLSNRAHDKSPESDFLKLEREVFDMKEKMEALQADLDLIKHVCNTLHANEGIEFIQEIAHQLQDMRRIMFDRRLVSSN